MYHNVAIRRHVLWKDLTPIPAIRRHNLMIYLLLRHHIEDFGWWKEDFDIHLAARQAGGATKETFVLRSVDELHEIVVVLGWLNLVQAQLFTKSVSWQRAMKEMGIFGVPEVHFLETAYN